MDKAPTSRLATANDNAAGNEIKYEMNTLSVALNKIAQKSELSTQKLCFVALNIDNA